MTPALPAFALLVAAQIAGPVAVHVSRGVAAREAGRLEEARRELAAAVRAAPDIAEAHLYLGLVLHESNDFSAAADSLGKALALKPGLPGARELLGYDLLMLGRAREAVPQLEAALLETPGKWRVAAWLGRALLESGDPGGALSHLADAQVAAPSDPEVLYLVGRAHSQLALHAQADLLATAADSAYAHLATAEDHDLNGRSDEAIAAYRRALAGNEALPRAWRALGDLEQGRGRHRAALEAYRRALAIRADDAALHLRCGEALLALGLAEEAIPHLETAAEAEPSPPAALETLGKALVDLDRYADAREALSGALSRAGDDQGRMKLHYQLARVSRKLGEVEAERVHLREFAALRAQLTADEK